MSSNGSGHISESERHARVLASWAEQDRAAITETLSSVDRQVSSLDEHVCDRIQALIDHQTHLRDHIQNLTDSINMLIESSNSVARALKGMGPALEMMMNTISAAQSGQRKAEVVRLFSAPAPEAPQPMRKATKRNSNNDKPNHPILNNCSLVVTFVSGHNMLRCLTTANPTSEPPAAQVLR